MGFLAETYVFTIIGLGIMQFALTWWAPYFAASLFIILFVSRMISTLFVQYLFVWLGSRQALTIKESIFLARIIKTNICMQISSDSS